MTRLLSLLAAACATSAALAQAPALSLERITADPPLAGRLPRQAEISPGGRWVSFLRPSQADSEVLELWAQPAAGGEPRKLVAAADLLGGAEQQLSEAEKMALERKRISQRGITSYQWCGGDDGALLFPLSGDLYVVRLTATGPQAHKLALDAGAAPKLEPRCAPDGKALAYVQGGNLFVLPLGGAADGAQPRQLTRDGSQTLGWGLAEFIAAEELSRQRGYWWSPDGKSLLALRVDEAGVALKTRAQIFADRTAMTEQRYPAAGEANAKVTAFVLDVSGGQRRELPLPAGAEYIARAGWFADGTPWLQWFNREQTRLTLTEFKANAAPRDITVETDAAWVEVHDDLIETPRGLLWSSEASGRRQLLLIDRARGTRAPLTQSAEPVAHAVCADARQIVFAAAGDLGKRQELYVQPLAGGPAAALPGAAERQWRDAKADAACKRLLVTRSAWGQPPRLELRGLGDAPAIPLAGDAPAPELKDYANTPQPLQLTAADGRTPLNAFFFAPRGDRAGRHPVIVMAYGGPGSSTVNWGWGRDMALIAYWQQRGYGVMTLDTRGMQHRDREFTRAHHRSFGQAEVADLFAAVRQLPGRAPGVDPARIGFFGWSYGGFLGARAVLEADTPFAAAVAVAPVTDWTLYDTAYTERYLGMPDGGKAASYASANLPSRAALLSRPLLLVHGTADDNVLFEHTLRLVEALQNAGKTFDLQIYPGKAHGIAGRAARLHLYRTMDAFFERHLKPVQ